MLQTDSSMKGIGVCVLQDEKPICYASRSLSKAEVNYAVIEKELNAILFGCEKFDYYIFGRQVTVHTDHKPLVSIFNKDINKIPSYNV